MQSANKPYLLIATAVAGLAAGCLSPVADTDTDEAVVDAPDIDSKQQALSGGSTDFGDALFGQVDDAIGRVGGGGCTGTLISETTFITAGHCVCGGGGGPDLDLASNCSARSRLTLDNGDVLEGDVVVYPEYAQNHWYAHDYAIVRLDTPYTAVEPVPVSERTMKVGEDIYHVGYGGSGVDCANGLDGRKRWGKVQVSEVNEDWDLDSSDPDIYLCGGDSGGPVLAGPSGGLYLVGVHSRGQKKGGADSMSTSKPAHLVWDWIIENSAPDGAPGNTWGECVYYTGSQADGQWRSVRNTNQPDMAAWNMDQSVRSVWVRKGYKATLYDAKNYGSGWTTTLDGFNGQACNEFGCLHDLTGTAYDRDISSSKCGSALPADTWGDCVYYPRFGDGRYVSVKGNVDLTDSYSRYNNKTSQVWVKKNHTATLYNQKDYDGWSLQLSGNSGGNWCNAYGCLYDLEGLEYEPASQTGKTNRPLANSMTSARCN